MGADYRWPLLAVAGGLFLGAGGFGLFRAASAEPVPAAPPQFRPAAGDLVPGGPVIPAALQTRPGDVLPVPDLPKPAAPTPKPAGEPLKLPSPPVELLPLPAVNQREAAPPPVPVLPLPIETPRPAPPAKSAEPPKPSAPAPGGLNLQPSEPRHNVKPVEPAPVPAPPVVFPAIPTARAADPVPTPSGDAPMPLTVRQATRAAVLGTALFAFPISADAQDPKPADPVKYADLEPIKEQLKALGKDVKAVKDALEGNADRGGLSDDGLLKSVRKLTTALDDLNRRLQSLENKVTDPTRTALASPIAGGMAIPITGGPAIPFAGRATVKVVNEYPVEVSMLVNGMVQRVPPSMTREIPVAPGTFRYQLLTSGAAEVASPIRDGETVTLRVR